MSQEAIQTVENAQETARQRRQEAVAAAKQAVEDAVLAGEARVRAAVEKAEAECADMMREAETGAVKAVQDMASNTENKKAAIRARAEKAMDRAVDLITERIVSASGRSE